MLGNMCEHSWDWMIRLHYRFGGQLNDFPLDGFIGGYGWRLVKGLADAERMPIKCLTSSLLGVCSALARRLFGVSLAFTRPFTISKTQPVNN